MGLGRQNTVLTMRAQSCFYPYGGELVGGKGGTGVYTFGAPVLYIAEKPDLPGNKNFFLDTLFSLPPGLL